MQTSDSADCDPDLYDTDFFAWTKQQAAALLDLSSSKACPGLDVAKIAEEIESLGKRDLREVRSSLLQVLVTLVKLQVAPDDLRRGDWWSEACCAHWAAADAFSPSMRDLLDMDDIWQGFRKIVRPYLDHSNATLKAPADCPFTLEEMLSEDLDLEEAQARVAALLEPSREGSHDPQ